MQKTEESPKEPKTRCYDNYCELDKCSIYCWKHFCASPNKQVEGRLEILTF